MGVKAQYDYKQCNLSRGIVSLEVFPQAQRGASLPSLLVVTGEHARERQAHESCDEKSGKLCEVEESLRKHTYSTFVRVDLSMIGTFFF